jgi:hypothetical protein
VRCAGAKELISREFSYKLARFFASAVAAFGGEVDGAYRRHQHPDEQACRHRIDPYFRHRQQPRGAHLRRGRREAHVKVKDLTDAEVASLRSQVAKFAVEGDLRREVSMNIKR